MSSGPSRQTIFDTMNRPYTLTSIVAQGGQGTIYEEASGSSLVKIARVRNAVHKDELQRRYHWLLQRDLGPNPAMIVPQALLAHPYTGYVMPRVRGHQPLTVLLRPTVGVSLGEWYNIETGGLRRRLRLAGLIARAFHDLHINGLAYCDLSDANILVVKDPKNASVVVVDPDNLSISGTAQSLVLGTPRFMAPEIIRGSHQPDSLSDSYSLAVLLFQLLRLNHPLLGDVVQNGPPELEEAALRGEYPYVDHETDETNRCTTVLPESATCTKELSSLFRRAFGDGLNVRTRRPTAGEWEEACLLAVDATTACPACSATFYPRPAGDNKHTCECSWCRYATPMPSMLRLSDYVYDAQTGKHLRGAQRLPIVIREEKTPIRARHTLDGHEGLDGDRIVAIVHCDQKVGSMVLENRSDAEMLLAHPASNKNTSVKPGKRETIVRNTQIYFQDPQKQPIVRAAGVMVAGGTQ